MKRRDFLKRSARLAGVVVAANQIKALAQTQAEAAARSGGAVVIDPKPLFDISPHLYMQFMEPLGVTDSSVEAAWDYNRDDWRKPIDINRLLEIRENRRPAVAMTESDRADVVIPF